MGRRILVHHAVWNELPLASHQSFKDTARDLGQDEHPARHPQVRAVRASIRGTHRLRVARYRVLFVVLPNVGAIVFTTAFLKRRDADYQKAARRHEKRVRHYE